MFKFKKVHCAFVVSIALLTPPVVAMTVESLFYSHPTHCRRLLNVPGYADSGQADYAYPRDVQAVLLQTLELFPDLSIAGAVERVKKMCRVQEGNKLYGDK